MLRPIRHPKASGASICEAALSFFSTTLNVVLLLRGARRLDWPAGDSQMQTRKLLAALARGLTKSMSALNLVYSSSNSAASCSLPLYSASYLSMSSSETCNMNMAWFCAVGSTNQEYTRDWVNLPVPFGSPQPNDMPLHDRHCALLLTKVAHACCTSARQAC